METKRPGGGDGAVDAAEATRWPLAASMPLTLVITLGSLVLLAGIWLTTLERIIVERDQAVASAQEANANLAIAFEQHTFRTLKAAEQVAAFVRERYLKEGKALDLRRLVDQQVIREGRFTVIHLVGADGHIISSSGPVGERVNYADRDFFSAQREARRDALFVGRPVLGRLSGRWLIPMALRITGADGGFAGLVVLTVEPADFTDFYRQVDLGPQGLLEVTGLDGIVRSRKVGGDLSFGMDARGFSWFTQRAVEREGSFVDPGADANGVARIVSYRTVVGYPLMVVVGTDYAEDLAPARQARLVYLLMAGGGTVVILGFSGLLLLVLARQRAAAAALQDSEALYRATFHQAAMGIAHIAPDGRLLRANEKFCRMLGYSREELLARTVFDLSDEDLRPVVRQFLARRLSSGSAAFPPEIEKQYRRKNGSTVWVCEALSVVTDPQGVPSYLVAVTQDITARKILEARLSHNALHDALTGLPNRVLLLDRLGRVLESARRHGELAGVLYLDLDGFKPVNDSLGHAAGDLLLQQVAERLVACVRAEDTVARVGGDEFAVVLAKLALPGDCEVVAAKIIGALAIPFDLEGTPVEVSASVGAAVYPAHGDTPGTLVAHADAAMYAAKTAGKNRFSWEIPRADVPGGSVA
ncbi:diguanylate cyclase domain-containing protein [Ramlibacter sp. MAHUQ-53]|uniref:sensor domain-containing diguanylate cyclase n=1 Tax=unclassified Ramlibacter TaxID=2617605 RepID=UPI00362E818F